MASQRQCAGHLVAVKLWKSSFEYTIENVLRDIDYSLIVM